MFIILHPVARDLHHIRFVLTYATDLKSQMALTYNPETSVPRLLLVWSSLKTLGTPPGFYITPVLIIKTHLESPWRIILAVHYLATGSS